MAGKSNDSLADALAALAAGEHIEDSRHGDAHADSGAAQHADLVRLDDEPMPIKKIAAPGKAVAPVAKGTVSVAKGTVSVAKATVPAAKVTTLVAKSVTPVKLVMAPRVASTTPPGGNEAPPVAKATPPVAKAPALSPVKIKPITVAPATPKPASPALAAPKPTAVKPAAPARPASPGALPTTPASPAPARPAAPVARPAAPTARPASPGARVQPAAPARPTPKARPSFPVAPPHAPLDEVVEESAVPVDEVPPEVIDDAPAGEESSPIVDDTQHVIDDTQPVTDDTPGENMVITDESTDAEQQHAAELADDAAVIVPAVAPGQLARTPKKKSTYTRKKKEPFYKSPHFRQTAIPVLYTGGVLFLVAGLSHWTTDYDSPLREVPVFLNIVLIVMALILITAGVLNAMLVKQQIADDAKDA